MRTGRVERRSRWLRRRRCSLCKPLDVRHREGSRLMRSARQNKIGRKRQRHHAPVGYCLELRNFCHCLTCVYTCPAESYRNKIRRLVPSLLRASTHFLPS